MDINGHIHLCEDYVSFEIAKLLKEKGFNIRCQKAYWPNGSICNQAFSNAKEIVAYSRPTLQMTMKWLREVHNILLVVDYEYECDLTPYYFKIYHLGENGKPKRVTIKGVSYDKDGNAIECIVGYSDWKRSRGSYSNYEQACEVAIKYCLENLI